MKHGHPPPVNTATTLIRYAAATTTAVTITAMTVYQEQVIKCVNILG